MGKNVSNAKIFLEKRYLIQNFVAKAITFQTGLRAVASLF